MHGWSKSRYLGARSPFSFGLRISYVFKMCAQNPQSLTWLTGTKGRRSTTTMMMIRSLVHDVSDTWGSQRFVHFDCCFLSPCEQFKSGWLMIIARLVHCSLRIPRPRIQFLSRFKASVEAKEISIFRLLEAAAPKKLFVLVDWQAGKLMEILFFSYHSRTSIDWLEKTKKMRVLLS